MASASELQLVLTAQDRASSVMKVFAGVMSSVVVGALSDAARAAADDAANTVKLQVAVENAGNSYEALQPIIAERIKRGQDLAFTDDATRDSLSALTATTGSFTSAMELQILAMDISRAKNMDLTTASELVGKVAQGNTGILARYGVVLKEGAGATEALAALQQKFGGQAEAYGATTSASIFKVKDSIDEWKESIGASLGPALQFVALLPGISAGFTAISAALALLTPAQLASAKASLAMIAPWLLIIATATLVVAALLQVYETVTLVTDNWNIFVYALKRGDLNEIPLFGFFFQKAQQVLGFIDNLRGAWNALQVLLGQRVAVGEFSGTVQNQRVGGERGFAEGIASVPFDMTARIHAGERIVPARQNHGSGVGGPTINIYIQNAYGDDLEQKVASAVRNVVQRGGLRGVTT